MDNTLFNAISRSYLRKAIPLTDGLANQTAILRMLWAKKCQGATITIKDDVIKIDGVKLPLVTH